MENKIPKKIHYCWFGNKKMPESVNKCIESWKRYCPDYEIILWNEDNYDCSKNRYTNEAYQVQKYGFVPDYPRLDIIYQHGGIYVDTDVEIIRNIDKLLENEAFMGFENNYVAPGLMFGARAQNKGIKGLMELYDEMPFVYANNTFNMTPSPKYITKYLLNNGLIQNNKKQVVNGITIFPTEFFCPKNPLDSICTITDNTFSIHHYDASWYGKDEKESFQRQVVLRRKSLWLWRIWNGVQVLKAEGIKSLLVKIKNIK